MQTTEAEIEKILSSPEYIYCERLLGRWHLRQCAINRARGRHDPYSAYVLCINCPRAKESEKKYGRPRKITDVYGFNYFPQIYLEDEVMAPEHLEALENDIADITAELTESQETSTPEPSPEPKLPTCKYHPDRPAKINKKGKPTGLCQECHHANASRLKNYVPKASPPPPPSPSPTPPALAPTSISVEKYLPTWSPEKEEALATALPKTIYDKLKIQGRKQFRSPYFQLLYILSHYFADKPATAEGHNERVDL